MSSFACMLQNHSSQPRGLVREHRIIVCLRSNGSRSSDAAQNDFVRARRKHMLLAYPTLEVRPFRHKDFQSKNEVVPLEEDADLGRHQLLWHGREGNRFRYPRRASAARARHTCCNRPASASLQPYKIYKTPICFIGRQTMMLPPSNS